MVCLLSLLGIIYLYKVKKVIATSWNERIDPCASCHSLRSEPEPKYSNHLCK